VNEKNYIYSDQMSLFGHTEIVGFGYSDFYIKEISWDMASGIIIKNHYSHKTDSMPHNKINLGIYINDKLLGVLQYGYAMNPASCSSIVKNTLIDEYLELNRMWIDDIAGKNSESKSLSYAIKYIKKKYPKIKWIQSFADERCNCLGIVYQASNFNFYGHHFTSFYEIDGEIYHEARLNNTKRIIHKWIKQKIDNGNAIKKTHRQFRYIYFIDKRCKKDCLLTEQPYPKYYLEKHHKASLT
jgi:hypothetical protein